MWCFCYDFMVVHLSPTAEPKDYIYNVACDVLLWFLDTYDVSVMISLLLISFVGLNYLYLSVVVFNVMVKGFIINYEAY